MASRWKIFESDETQKAISRVPKQVKEKYRFWKVQIEEYGPIAIRMHNLPGFKDHALKGVWEGYRSSRLNKQYRVIYRIDDLHVSVFVRRIGPHDY